MKTPGQHFLLSSRAKTLSLASVFRMSEAEAETTFRGVRWEGVQPPEPHRCLSVGFVAKENDLGVILVPTIADVDHADNSHVYGGIMIPTGSIIVREALR